MTELKHGDKATSLECRHTLKTGSTLVLLGMDYEQADEETFVFVDEQDEIQYLSEGEFKWIEEISA